ncbi:Protein ZBED8 [Portunus trituberculatus]|uniref:Protein ZBED8 n=1 Tax=Portunus trituberculatus TaxID=210409 RepID=A0A5B7FRZ4_PORTR|nr:Protein ZBED8 [Portunus trituberculatus]
MLCTSFDGYFSCGELRACNNWILNPFMQNLEDVDDDGSIKKDLIDMRHNRDGSSPQPLHVVDRKVLDIIGKKDVNVMDFEKVIEITLPNKKEAAECGLKTEIELPT